jgi:hypothetical protein
MFKETKKISLVKMDPIIKKFQGNISSLEKKRGKTNDQTLKLAFTYDIEKLKRYISYYRRICPGKYIPPHKRNQI